jgi:hypothetical protein
MDALGFLEVGKGELGQGSKTGQHWVVNTWNLF